MQAGDKLCHPLKAPPEGCQSLRTNLQRHTFPVMSFPWLPQAESRSIASRISVTWLPVTRGEQLIAGSGNSGVPQRSLGAGDEVAGQGTVSRG